MKSFMLIVLCVIMGCTETKKEKSKPHDVGFTTIHTVDSSRIYKPGTDTTHYLHFRPIDLDIWYPSNHSSTDSLLLVRDLFGLLESRANYYSASHAGNGVTTQLAQFFCETFNCSDSTKLLNFKTNSFKNAPAVTSKFPLIVYLTAFEGMSYENFALFEALAKKGFIVASVSSIGRFPGNMTTKKEDLMEQVNDAIFAVNALKKNVDVDFGTIGIVGYSWGGLAGAILASKVPGVKCIVSLEGSEFHHYGNEDIDFDAIKNSEDFKNIKLSIPYLRLESGVDTIELQATSPYALYHANPKVAVLTSWRTGSAGELVALSFKHRPNTKQFGSPTYGVTTLPHSMPLSDSAYIVVYAARQTDRLGTPYGGKVYPDVPVSDDGGPVDKVIEAAINWLKENN